MKRFKAGIINFIPYFSAFCMFSIFAFTVPPLNFSFIYNGIILFIILLNLQNYLEAFSGWMEKINKNLLNRINKNS